MIAAKITSGGVVTRLGGSAGPAEVITEADVQDPQKLARYLGTLLADVAALKRTWNPRRIDFEDVSLSTGGTRIYLTHEFGGRVRWHVIDWPDSAGAAPDLRKDETNTTTSTLVLRSYVAGTVSIRVEECG